MRIRALRAALALASTASLLGLAVAACTDDATYVTPIPGDGGPGDGAPGDGAPGDGAPGEGGLPAHPMAKSSLPRDPGSPAAVPGAVTANNAFAVDLYAHLRASEPAGNLLTAPYTASIALTMTYAGAVGDTATQRATALHLGSAASTIFDGQNALSQAIEARAAVALAQAQASHGGADAQVLIREGAAPGSGHAEAMEEDVDARGLPSHACTFQRATGAPVPSAPPRSRTRSFNVR